MCLHPEAAAFLEQRAAWGVQPAEKIGVVAAREQAEGLARLRGPGREVARTEDRHIDGPGGALPLRIYTPAGAGPFPILVFYHGGGWVTGSLDTGDAFCRMMTDAAVCVTVSVNYRHAPEHRHPAAAEDAWAGAVWAARNAASFAGDASRLAVAGASSGGNLAAVTALMARARGEPALAFQLLIYPVCDCDFDTESYRVNAEGYGLSAVTMRWSWDLSLPDAAARRRAWASPLREPDLSGLPPAFVATAELDPLRDEAEAYARRLADSGVPTRLRRYDGMVHGFLGAQADADLADALRGAWVRHPSAANAS